MKTLASIVVLFSILVESSGTVGNVSNVNFVLWHGLGQWCCGKNNSIDTVRSVLSASFSGARILSIGENKSYWDDIADGFVGSVNEKVDEACQYLSGIEYIREYGYHAIGFSQGSQFQRALLQRCTNLTVHSLLTLAGQQQGVYGIPFCPVQLQICQFIRSLIDRIVYTDFFQSLVVPAQYWHSPIGDRAPYRNKSAFLADINQERHFNPIYKQRMLSLKRLILVQFDTDEIITPIETSQFGFYKNDSFRAVPMQNLSTWDSLGLRELKETGRLVLVNVSAGHLDVDPYWFQQTIGKIYQEII